MNTKSGFEQRQLIFFDTFIFIIIFRLLATLPMYQKVALNVTFFGPILSSFVFLFVQIGISLIFLAYFGSYLDDVPKAPQALAVSISKSFLTSLVFVGFLSYMVNFHTLSRTFLILYLTSSFLSLFFARIVLNNFLHSQNRAIHASRNILVSGDEPGVLDFFHLLRKHSLTQYSIKGILYLKEKNGLSTDNPAFSAVPVFESIENLESILRDHVIDEVIFSFHQSTLPNIEKWVLTCEKMGVTVRLVVNFFEVTISKTFIESFYGLPMITYTTIPMNRSDLLIKRIIDVLGTLCGLVVLFPLFIIIGAAIKLDSKGPVFYKQVRLGQYGRKFVLYKFRSMVSNADELKPTLISQNEMQWPVFKMKDDPRVTMVGRFLRKYSLDELPQIVNVLKGEISLVGPRPALPEEAEHYHLWHRRRLSMKPGLTCLWQIKGRNDIDFEEWMKLDLEYIDKWSLWLDFIILIQTLPAILSGRGAS